MKKKGIGWAAYPLWFILHGDGIAPVSAITLL